MNLYKIKAAVQVKRVKEYMADPRFNVKELRAVSLAGSGLLKWVFAMVNYFIVARGVEPKRRKVADAEKSLRAAQKELAQIKARQQQALLGMRMRT